MVGIFLFKNFFTSTNKDTRFYKRKVRIPKNIMPLFKRNTVEELVKIGYCYVDLLPWDTITLMRFLTPITLSTNSNLNAITHEILLKSNYFYWFLCLLRFELTYLFFPHDIAYTKNMKDNNFFLFSPLSCLFFHINIYIRQELSKECSIFSLSEVFQGTTWVERELSEFHHLYMVGLRDGRRLLTDYGTSQFKNDDYKTVNYNLISQELFNV